MEDFKWTTDLVKEILKKVTSYRGDSHWTKEIKDFIESKTKAPEFQVVSYIGDYAGRRDVIFSFICECWQPVGLSLINNYQYPPCVYEVDLKEKAKIFSVKRLSDGHLFVVGDEVFSTWGFQKIVGFTISNDGSLVVNFSTCNNPLEKISHKRTILFTTHDDVDIFEEGVKIFMVFNDLTPPCNSGYSTRWKVIPRLSDKNNKGNEYYKLFSDRENAEDYILENEPKLSVNDIASLWCINASTKNILKEFAKKKSN